MRRKRIYTEEFRRLAVARMQGCHNISALAKELDVPRRLLYRWQMRMQAPVAPIAPRYPGLEDENRQLKQLLAERTPGAPDLAPEIWEGKATATSRSFAHKYSPSAHTGLWKGERQRSKRTGKSCPPHPLPPFCRTFMKIRQLGPYCTFAPYENKALTSSKNSQSGKIRPILSPTGLGSNPGLFGHFEREKRS